MPSGVRRRRRGGGAGRGRALLADWNADLLIWGEVKKADQELNLWFLVRGESTLGAPSYSLTEKLTLPADFEADLGAQVVAVAAAAVAPATEQAGTYLVDLLQPVAAKLERLVANPPAGMEAERIADLHVSLALATQTIGEQSGERDRSKRSRLPRGARGVDPRARPARLGHDPEQPRHRAWTLGRAGERHGASGGGGRGLPRRARGVDPRARPARLGDDPEQPRQRACDARASGRAARRAWRRRSRLPRGARGVDPRARPARLGHDPEQPRQRASDAWASGRAARRAWRRRSRLPRRARGVDPRARPARVGHDPEQPRQRASDARASGRAARRAWRRRSRPTARRSRSGPASASRSTGP